MAANTSRSVMQKESSMKSYRDTSYREKPATPNSPSGTTVTTMYDHMLSPSSPADVEEKEGRLPNHFLDEVVSDIRSDDSMDLDFDDFCHNEQQQAVQRPLAGQQRYPSGEQRRASATGSSSYSTSDSLCAMAKLTHSIANENAMADGEGRRSSPDCSSLKQEPCYGEVETTSGVNDTDQGKAAAAGKLALQKQMSEAGSNSMDLKRKREMAGQEANGDQSNGGMSSHSQQMAPPAQRRQSYLDYSYQDDFAMADMTEPDTMINFSELPQQPNYYQCPQSAEDSLNLGFNVSLQASNQAFAPTQPPTSIPTAHHHPATNMARYPFSVPSQSGDASMGRSSPHNRVLGHSGPVSHQGSFHPYQAQESAAMPGSLHQPPGAMQRSESFPGATLHHSSVGQFHSVASAPVQEPSKSEAAHHSVSSASAPPRSVPSLTSSTGSRTPSINGSNTQQDFLQQLISDSSSAFRSHPLFPLLRDLIIADINFFEKSFPHKLIVNLPADFDKLLRNYLSRNPPKKDYQCIQSVESVLMDALKYAHHILIEKINQWKVQERQKMPANQPMPAEASALSAPMSRLQSVGEYCDGANIKHDMSQAGFVRSQMNVAKPISAPAFRPSRREPGSIYGDMGPPTPGSTYSQPLSVDTGSVENASVRQAAPATSQPGSMYTPGQPHYHQHPLSGNYSRSPNPRNPYMPSHGGPPCPPPNYTVSPNNPPPSRHQQTMYEMPPPSGMYADPNTYHDPYNSCMPPPSAHHRLNHLGANERHLMYMNNINDPSLVKAVMDGGKDMYESMSDTASVISAHSMQGSVKGPQQGQGKPTEGRKHASLPKEAVNIMLNWLREHQDKPYPNDDEKGMLIKQTGLSITQINYWFTNARRRLLPKWRGEDM